MLLNRCSFHLRWKNINGIYIFIGSLILIKLYDFYTNSKLLHIALYFYDSDKIMNSVVFTNLFFYETKTAEQLLSGRFFHPLNR